MGNRPKPRVLATLELPAERLTAERQIAAEDDVKELLRKVAPDVRKAEASLFVTLELR